MTVYLIVKNKQVHHEDPYGGRNDWVEEVPTVATFDSYNKFYEVVKKMMLANEEFKAYNATEYKVTATVEIKIE